MTVRKRKETSYEVSFQPITADTKTQLYKYCFYKEWNLLVIYISKVLTIENYYTFLPARLLNKASGKLKYKGDLNRELFNTVPDYPGFIRFANVRIN